jgi:outer membrane lipoprotein carrier protein
VSALHAALVILLCLRARLQFAICAFLILFSCLVFPGQNTLPAQRVSSSSRLDVQAIVGRLEARYRSAARLEAAFLERYTENGALTRLEAGKVYFERPGKMRWDYESPEKNVFLVDGKNAWFYVPADHTVTRVPAKRSTDWRTPLSLLVGEMKVSRICNRIGFAVPQAPEYSADVMLYCEPRGASNAREGGDSGRKAAPPEARDRVYLEVEESSGELVRVLMNDPGGVGLEFRFADWRMNPQLDDSLFRFQVPPGVAIVNGDVAAAQKMASP